MRAFLAIELPEELRGKVLAFGQKITGGLDIKLVERENLHLTLVFLGDISEEEARRVIGGFEECGGFGEIRLRLGKAEIFPDKRRPHGVWINVEGDKEKLFSLYRKIVDKLLNTGIDLEKNDLRFSPHITIGRIKRRIGDFREVEGVGGEFTINKIALFQSKLSSKGPKYTKIGEFAVK